MPNFYTHLRFARETFAQLPAELQNSLKPEYDSYLLGNFGPDPLYFGGKRGCPSTMAPEDQPLECMHPL